MIWVDSSPDQSPNKKTHDVYSWGPGSDRLLSPKCYISTKTIFWGEEVIHDEF